MDVELNLKKSGKNKLELLKVINHYLKPQDSLKLKAAYFLIANMHDLKYIDSSEFKSYDNIFEKFDSLFYTKKILNITDKRHIEIDNYWNEIQIKNIEFGSKKFSIYNDITTIHSDFLIRNIDLAFLAWQNNSWSRHIKFEDFCEYILPYRIQIEAPKDWRTPVIKEYSWVSDSLKDKNNVKELCILLCEKLKWFKYNSKVWHHPLLGLKNLKLAKCGPCANKVELNIFTMRALGIAVTKDYAPYWANRDWNHGWNAFISTDNNFLDFEGFAERKEWGGRMKKEGDSIKMSKVFRVTFSVQKNSLAELVGVSNLQTIPSTFHGNRFIDVSKEYFPVSNVILQLRQNVNSHQFSYLCTYNRNAWVAVHWARNENTKAIFKNMGRDVLYMPMYFNGKKYEPAGHPFILLKNNKVKLLKPTYDNPIKITKLFKTHPIFSSDKITKNKTYELFFWDNKWISLGKQNAITNFLVFSDIPANAVYWLKHLDKSEEEQKERIFTLENGTQQWW